MKNTTLSTLLLIGLFFAMGEIFFCLLLAPLLVIAFLRDVFKPRNPTPKQERPLEPIEMDPHVKDRE